MTDAVDSWQNGQKHLAVLTGDRINEGFFTRNVWPFCQAAKEK